MNEYNDNEIELAKRIHDATMLVSDRITTRRARNLAKKFGFPSPDESPDAICLETARALLKHYDEELNKIIRDAVEGM
jgi:hypothetical protein